MASARPRPPPVRVDRPTFIGGVSVGNLAAALGGLTVAWWPFPEALPVTAEARPHLEILLAVVWSVVVLAVGRVFEDAINWIRGAER